MQAPSPKESLGALRALTRIVEDTTLLTLAAGTEIVEQPGDRLLAVWWFPSEEEAVKVKSACLELLAAARFHINRAGFSAFPANKLRNLVGQAFLRAAVEPLWRQAGPREQKPPKPWTQKRIARLGYLIGCGFEAKEIADDPEIDTTPAAVQRQANRLGLALSQKPNNQLIVRVTREARTRLSHIAAKQNRTPEALLRRCAERVEELEPLLFHQTKVRRSLDG